MYIKKPTHPFLGACLLLLVHVWFTPNQGPKGFKNAIFRNQTMKMWPWKLPFQMGQLHGPWYKQPLVCMFGEEHCVINTSSWGPLHTRDWVPVTITLQALSLVEKVELVQVRFTLRSRDKHSMWMQDGCKLKMDSYMALNESCFMVAWIIFKNHLLEVGLTQNQEVMALRTVTTVDLVYSIMSEDPHE
jgi:hypothetical protein